jgi:hypothetical protein
MYMKCSRSFSTGLATLAAAVAAAALFACKGDEPTRSPVLVSRTALNGDYTCVQFEGYFIGANGLGPYGGTCRAYTTVTNPSRRDSIELAPFTIGEDNTLSRLDFPSATIAYDSSVSKLTAIATDGRVDSFTVIIQQGVLYLVANFQPFDYTGDGVADSLRIFYQRR